MTMAIEPGWYFARMKTWATQDGMAPVRVTRNGSADPCQVWQCGDQRPWPVDAWEFGRRMYPDIESATDCNPLPVYSIPQID
jgi:hypothetical protein